MWGLYLYNRKLFCEAVCDAQEFVLHVCRQRIDAHERHLEYFRQMLRLQPLMFLRQKDYLYAVCFCGVRQLFQPCCRCFLAIDFYGKLA